jgi:hypothetical protein
MNTKQQDRAMALLAVGVGLIGGVALSQLSTAGAPVGIQQTPQTAEVVRAEKFALLGRTGARRAVLELESNGEPALKLYDEEGNLRAGLSLRTDGGPNLLFWDGQTTIPRAGLALLPNGSPSLELADRNGNLRTVLGLATDGEPVLGLFDHVGNLRAALCAETREAPIS